MPHDLFLSYNRVDADAVREVREQLVARGVRTFIDWNDLDAGRPWPEALEHALRGSRAVAVFLGKAGLGVWQKRELYYALDLQGRSDLRVAPVLLRGADPPAGFLALNTWVDFRGGVSPTSVEPLVRMLQGAAQEPARVNVNPYRHLRSFREEDAGLFFGRQEAIEEIVDRVDRAGFVAIVGPSGSGKSSVALAGVLPRLRGRRPPSTVWDSVVFTPGTDPWRGFADALVPVLEPAASPVEKIYKGGVLREALPREGGIASTIAQVLAQSRGTDRLLVLIDQFEEFFTQVQADVAREFLRALFDASRSTPVTVLVTLRSDYYGKAIALDRDLSNALPAAQVNLGPMRPDELCQVIVKPATVAGLSFEPRLVDRMLEDVGREPGNLPLLEFALSELWELRSGGELTFAAYEEIGGVSGALARRANALYESLGSADKSAARRLMTRLVRVSAADEEGADTRRRARRDEIDEEAWKLVEAFARARLLVVGENDVVEVAHEALIRKWERLRDWLDEDRKFLLWRQQLAVYREAWPDVLPAGRILEESQKWWRTRRAELSAAEREYIERSATARMRSRKVLRVAAIMVLVGVLLSAGFAAYQRTTRYNIQRILDGKLEDHFFGSMFYGPEYERDVANLAVLIRLGRDDQLLRNVRTIENEVALSQLAIAMHVAGKHREALELLERAEAMVPAGSPAVADVVRAWVRIGEPGAARTLLNAFEGKRADNLWIRQQVAESWLLLGDRERARRALLRPGDAAVPPQLLDTLIRLREPVDAERIAAAIDGMLMRADAPEERWRFQHVAETFAEAGDFEQATRMWRACPFKENQRAIFRTIVVAQARLQRRVPNVQVLQYFEDEDVADRVIDEILSHFVREKRHAEIQQLLATLPPVLRARARAHTVKHLVNAGRFDEIIQQASSEPSFHDLSSGLHRQTLARLAYALARAGKRERAALEIERQLLFSDIGSDEARRDEVRAILAAALAVLGRYQNARAVAESIENDDQQREAYFAILRTYADRAR